MSGAFRPEEHDMRRSPARNRMVKGPRPKEPRDVDPRMKGKRLAVVAALLLVLGVISIVLILSGSGLLPGVIILAGVCLVACCL